MNRRADPNTTPEDLAKSLLEDYEIDPMTCVLTNKKRKTRIHLTAGGVVSTPYRSITAQTLLYIMTYHCHPKEDDAATRAKRMHSVKGRLLNHAVPKPPKEAKPKPIRMTNTDKIELLRQAMLSFETRLATLEANQPKEP